MHLAELIAPVPAGGTGAEPARRRVPSDERGGGWRSGLFIRRSLRVVDRGGGEVRALPLLEQACTRSPLAVPWEHGVTAGCALYSPPAAQTSRHPDD